MTARPLSDRGSSAVEYGLIAGGVVVTFLVAFIGLQAAVGAVFGRGVDSVEQVGPGDPSRDANLLRSRPIAPTPAP